MLLHLEHDARWLASRANVAPPACDTLIVRHGAPGELFGCRTRANLLDEHAAEPWMFDPMLPHGPDGIRLLSWSGSLAPDGWLSPEPGAAEPRNWLSTGRAALDAACDRVRPALERHEARLCFIPHCRHVLSDVKSTIHFRAARIGQPFEVALDPIALLETSMLEHLDEHLERMFTSLGPIAAAVFLADCRPPEDEGHLPRRVALGDGLLARDHVRRLILAHVPPETPIVIDGRDAARQVAWLGR